MNALQQAKQSIQGLAALLRNTGQARSDFEARRAATLPAPRATQLRIKGGGMVQVCDADTGRVLGFRPTYREASWLAQSLERGAHAQQ